VQIAFSRGADGDSDFKAAVATLIDQFPARLDRRQ